MRVVVDTNVVVSGVFFGRAPRRVVEAVANAEIKASATSEIVDEYDRVVAEMIARKHGKLRRDALSVLMSKKAHQALSHLAVGFAVCSRAPLLPQSGCGIT